MGVGYDLTGQRFGKLVAIERMPNVERSDGKKPRTYWLCRCDCGNVKKIMTQNLVNGYTQSCGCGLIKHGYCKKERLYSVWRNMVFRCSNKHHAEWARYGGRGITICPEWGEYINFRNWAMSSGYTDELTIDRIDNDGNYCPENCRWATRAEQNNNKSTNHFLSYGGKTMTVKQWADELGFTYSAVLHRVQRGWSMERIVSTPQKGVVI